MRQGLEACDDEMRRIRTSSRDISFVLEYGTLVYRSIFAGIVGCLNSSEPATRDVVVLLEILDYGEI